MGKAMKLIMALIILLAITPCYAAGPSGFTLYDDFNGTFINPSLWFGQESESNTSNRVLREDVRQIEKNQLHLKACAWGCTHCGSTTQYVQSRLIGTGLQNATALQATVLVKAVAATGTNDNADYAIARARIMAYLFNDGESTGSNDQTGDVFAYIGVERLSNSSSTSNVLEVHGRVGICTNAACSNSTLLEETDQLGTLNVGKKATIYMEWDKANNQVLFKKTVVGANKKPLTLSQTVNYGTFSTVNAPVYNVKRLDAYCQVANGTISGQVLMDAYFDDIYYK